MFPESRSRQSRQPCRHVAIPSLSRRQRRTFCWMSSFSLGTNTWTGWSRDGFLHLSNRPPADAGVLIGLGMPCMRLRVDARISTMSGCATRRSRKRRDDLRSLAFRRNRGRAGGGEKRKAVWSYRAYRNISGGRMALVEMWGFSKPSRWKNFRGAPHEAIQKLKALANQRFMHLFHEPRLL